VIDHNIGSIMIPMILIGSYIGVFINLLAPPAIVGVALSIFMIYLSITTFQKGCRLFQQESEDEEERIKSAFLEEERQPLMLEADTGAHSAGEDEKNPRTSTGETPNTYKSTLPTTTGSCPTSKDAPSDQSEELSADSLANCSVKQVLDENEAESLEMDQIVESEKTECGQWSS